MVTPWPQPTIYDYSRREPSFDLTRRDGSCCVNGRCSSPHGHHHHHHQPMRAGPFGDRRPSVVPGHHPHAGQHHHDGRTSIMADREEENATPRKRIAVAVGHASRFLLFCLAWNFYFLFFFLCSPCVTAASPSVVVYLHVVSCLWC
jgi:hypothetical protein